MARFTADKLAGLAPLEVLFDASASSADASRIVGYAWDFGDGALGTGIVASHVYERTGQFRARLTVTAEGGAFASAEAVITISGTRPITLAESSPRHGEGGVAVTRETILRFDGPIDPASATSGAVFAEFGGETVDAILYPSADGKRLTLFYSRALPASSTVRVIVDGDLLRDGAGGKVDGDGDGQPGGAAVIEFSTLGLTFVPGTSVCGRVFASELASTSEGEPVNFPLAGVVITVDGVDPNALSAVTDAMGDFRLEPAPSGGFFVHIRGYTAEGVPPGSYYPAVGKAWEAVPGEETKVGDVFLPEIKPGTLQTVSTTAETRVCFAESVLAELPPWYRDICLTVPPGALLLDPNFAGETPVGQIGIAPVDPSRLPAPLPAGLDPPLVITVQTDGAENFDSPVPICFPNLPDPKTGMVLPPGSKTALWSFNHDSGIWEVVGPMTVSADGRTACTDPGTGIKGPGWHTAIPGVPAGGGTITKKKEDDGSKKKEPAPGDKKEPADDDCDGDAFCPYGRQINLASGEERFERTDLVIPGRGEVHFVLRRTYRSRLEYDGPLGHGWDFSYNEALFRRTNGDATRLNGRGRLDLWRRAPGGGFAAPPGNYRTLSERPDGSFVLRSADGFRRHYHADGRLMAHVDRHGNQMVFEYDNRGNLDLVIDPFGREIRFIFAQGPDGQDRLARVRDFNGREVLYTYDARGDLVAVRTPIVTGTSTGNDFPDGRTERYVYSSGFSERELNHNLLAVYAPQEVATESPLRTPGLELVYGTDPGDPVTFDLVIEERVGGGRSNASGSPAGGITRFQYGSVNAGVPPGDPDLPRGKATITEANGNLLEYFTNELGHHILSRRPTRGLRPGEPAFYEVRSYFDADGQLVRRVFPEGNEVIHEYDSAGPRSAHRNVLRTRHVAGPRGGDGAGSPIADLVVTMTYEPLYNQISSLTDPRAHQAGFMPPLGVASIERYTARRTFDYQEGSGPIRDAEEFGIDLTIIDRGLGDVNADGRTDQTAGNIVRDEEPAVALRADSNEARLRGATTQPILTEIVWNESGQPLRVVDPEGNVTSLEYYSPEDPDGDGTAVFSPYFLSAGPQGGGYLRASTADSGPSPRRRAAALPSMLQNLLSYDPVGNLIAVEDPRGIVTRIEVNELDETVVVTRGAAITARAQGELLTGEAALAYRTRYVYDHNGRRIKSEIENRDGPPGNTDPSGLGAFAERTFVYDLLGSVVEAIHEADSGTTLRWRYQYDPKALLTRIVKPEGNALAIEYDERNLPYKLTRGFGATEAATTQVDYDQNGNRRRYADAEDNDGNGQGEVTTYVYDGFDRRIETRDALGNREQAHYDPASNVVRRVFLGHPAGRPLDAKVRLAEAFYRHDELNRVYQTDAALFLASGFAPARTVELDDDNGDGLVTTRQEFDALGLLTFLVEDDGEATQAVYDGAHRQVELIDPLGNRIRTIYDASSNPTRVESIEVSPEGLVSDESFTTHYVYDQLDRLVRVTDNAGQTTRLAHDSRDNLVHRSDPEGTPAADPLGLSPLGINLPGNTTSWHYDGLDRRVAEIHDLRQGGQGGQPLDLSNGANPDGRVTVAYRLDGNSRLQAIIDDLGQTTAFGYDALDRLTLQRFADASERRYTFDRDSNLTRVTDANGSVTTLSRDALHRLIRITVARGPGVGGTTEETFAYDGLSRLTRHLDNNGAAGEEQVHERIYDSLSRLLEEHQNGQVISQSLSGDGKRTRCVLPGGRSLSYTHDALDRIKAIDDGTGAIFESSWIGPGLRELQRLNKNGTVLSFLDAGGGDGTTYDAVRRITRLRCLLPGGAAFVDRAHAYNRAGHRLSERRNDDAGRTDTYDYDSLYRLVESSFDEQVPPGGPRRDVRSRAYTLDGVGSRRLETAATAGGNQSTANAVNAVNAYTAVAGAARTYDSNGNLTQAAGRTYVHDYRDRLVEVSEAGRPLASYRYLGDSRRSRKIVYSPTTPGQVLKETDYFYDGWTTCEERDGTSGQTEATYVHHPVYLDEVVEVERTAAHPLGPARLYLHQNARADVVAVTNAAGQVVERVVYDDFGLPSPASAVGNPFLFQGQRFDAETGLYYARHRYYDPRLGRFIERDPVWDGLHHGGWYTFAGNGPVSRRDPLGLQSDGEAGSQPSALSTTAKAVGFAESASNLSDRATKYRKELVEKLVTKAGEERLGKLGTGALRRVPLLGGIVGAVEECFKSKEDGWEKAGHVAGVGVQRGLTSLATFPEAVLCGAAGERTPLADTFDHFSRTGEWDFDPNGPESVKAREAAEAAKLQEQKALQDLAFENQQKINDKIHEHNLKKDKEAERRGDDERLRKLGASPDKLIQRLGGCRFDPADSDKRTPQEKERLQSLRKQGAKDPEEVMRLQNQLQGGR